MNGEEYASTEPTSLGWWAVSGDDLMAMLRAAASGADPDLLYAEHYANSEHPCTACGGAGRVGVSYPTDYGTGTEWDWVECPNGCPEKLHMVSGELYGELEAELERMKKDRDEWRMLAEIGCAANECRVSVRLLAEVKRLREAQ